MWYEDLTECDYFGEEFSGNLTAIGWLENGKNFSTGISEKSIYDKLCNLSENPWEFGMFMGLHQCDLCQFQGEQGTKNIFVPNENKIYVSPELITHYINAHSYLPPSEFIEAVQLCPPMRSMEYLKKMLENGGRKLVKSAKENQ